MRGLPRIVCDKYAREKEGRRGLGPWSSYEPTDIILRSLEKEAQASPDREAYRELVRIPGVRLGLTAVLVGSDKVALVVDVLVDRSPCSAAMEAALARRGYASARLDEGWVAHERSVARRRLSAEWRFLRGLIEAPEGSA